MTSNDAYCNIVAQYLKQNYQTPTSYVILLLSDCCSCCTYRVRFLTPPLVPSDLCNLVSVPCFYLKSLFLNNRWTPIEYRFPLYFIHTGRFNRIHAYMLELSFVSQARS